MNLTISGSRNGQHYDEDILIERDTGNSRRRPLPRRSPSPPPRSAYSPRDDLDIADEAEYYNQRAGERSYIGEGYHGATKDWAIVDVPPGTKRVQVEGVGGASQEVTWQRYNGVRRSKFIAEEDVYPGDLVRHEPLEDTRDRGRRFVGQKPRTDIMWTEITKDLVVKEAIEEMGYDYEETEFFFYVMVYLRYVRPSSLSPFTSPVSPLHCSRPSPFTAPVPPPPTSTQFKNIPPPANTSSLKTQQEDVLHLVELTEAVKRDRRERIREIEFERSLPRDRPRKPLALPWDEEKIYEREIIYDAPPARKYR